MSNSKDELKSQLDHLLYCRNVKQSYSPSIQKILDLYVDFIPLMIRKYEAGENVIWTMGLMTDVVLCYGNGAIPASYTELGRMGASEEIAAAQNHFQIPVETCSMVKANLGEFFMYRDTFPKRILYSSRDCEPYNMIFEVLNGYGYDVHLFDIGKTPSANSPERREALKEHYRAALMEKIRWISGKEPDLARMHEEQIRYNRVQQKLKKIIELRYAHPTYIASLAYMIMFIGNGHYMGKPEEYEAALDGLIAEMEALGENEFHDEKVVLGWYGVRGQEFNIFETIDESGGAVLAFNLPNSPVNEYNTDLDPIDAILDFEFNDMSSKSMRDKSANILEGLHKVDAKGVIFYGFLGCSMTSINFEMTRKYLAEYNIPTLNLVGSFDVGSVTGQVTTRIQAFIEMLEKEK